MLKIIVAVLVLFWLFGMLSSLLGFFIHLAGGILHILLIIALIIFVIDWLSNRTRV